MGIPSTFIRVSGCNLRCVWCDTPYASWNPEGPVLNIDEIIEKVGDQHVVITGGEPMLFDAVEILARNLKAKDHIITIETAGTIYRDIACDLMSISPKLGHSTPGVETGWAERHESLRLNIEALTQLIQNYEVQLKFVVANIKDFDEIEALLMQLPAIPKDRILIMPEGIDSKTLNQSMRALVEPVCQRGWRLCPRLHVDLFGNTRGT